MSMKALRTTIAILLGLGFLLLLISAVLRLLPISPDPYDEGAFRDPYPLLSGLAPFIGLVGILFLFAGIFGRSKATKMRLAVGAALYMVSLFPGTGQALVLLNQWAIGSNGETLTLSALTAAGVMLLPQLAFMFLLVGAILGFPAWARWAISASFALIIAAHVHAITLEWPHWRNVLQGMGPYWLQQSGILAATWMGTICIAAAFLLYLILTRRMRMGESLSKPEIS